MLSKWIRILGAWLAIWWHNVLSAGLSFGGGPNSLVKSIQEVEITIAAASTSNTATLGTTVVKQNSIVLFHGRRTGSNANRDEINCRIELTNNTTVTASVNSASTNAADRIVRATVVEFYPWAIKNIVHDTLTITAGNNFNTKNLGFSVAVPGNTFIAYLGNTTNNTADSGRISSANAGVILSGSDAQGIRGGSANSVVVGYCAVEFQPGVVQASEVALINVSSGLSSNTKVLSSLTNANHVLTFWGGAAYTDGFTTEEVMGYLVSAISAKVERSAAASSNSTCYMKFLQFNPKFIKDRQAGQDTFTAGQATKDISIGTGISANRLVNYIGHKTTNAFSNTEYTLPTIKTKDSDELRLERATGTDFGYVPTVSWEMLEFYHL